MLSIEVILSFLKSKGGVTAELLRPITSLSCFEGEKDKGTEDEIL